MNRVVNIYDWPHFVLSGDFDPAAITARLGIEPTVAMKVGTPIDGTDRTWGASSWILACGDEEAGCDVQDQIIFLLFQLEACKAEVASLCKEYRGDLNLFACLDGNIPGFFLGSEILRKLAELNVDLECKFVRSSEICGEVKN